MSDLVNTGMRRAVELTVSKQVNGQNVSGYPHVYKLRSAFGDNAETTDSELALLSIDDYQARLSTFKAYVESVENGLTVDLDAAYEKNLISCPI